jgi:hypothetical protein
MDPRHPGAKAYYVCITAKYAQISTLWSVPVKKRQIKPMLLSSYYYYYDLVHGARSRLSLAHVMPTVQVGV